MLDLNECIHSAYTPECCNNSVDDGLSEGERRFVHVILLRYEREQSKTLSAASTGRQADDSDQQAAANTRDRGATQARRGYSQIILILLQTQRKRYPHPLKKIIAILPQENYNKYYPRTFHLVGSY